MGRRTGIWPRFSSACRAYRPRTLAPNHLTDRQILSRLGLPIKLMNEMGDILAVLSPDDAYGHLKAAIMRRTTESESSEVRQLLNGDYLGDWRPGS